MIVTKATVLTKSGMMNHVKAICVECAIKTRKEDGCYSYEFLLSSEDENSGVFIELWRDQEAINAHIKTPHFITMMENLKPYLETPLGVRLFDANELKR